MVLSIELQDIQQPEMIMGTIKENIALIGYTHLTHGFICRRETECKCNVSLGSRSSLPISKYVVSFTFIERFTYIDLYCVVF